MKTKKELFIEQIQNSENIISKEGRKQTHYIIIMALITLLVLFILNFSWIVALSVFAVNILFIFLYRNSRAHYVVEKSILTILQVSQEDCC